MQGLEIGAPVKYRGVTIGRVTDIGLVSAEYGGGQPIDVERSTYRLVFVRYEVDTTKIGQMPDTARPWQLGLRARLASQGITGLSYLELDFVDPARYPALDVPWQPKADIHPVDAEYVHPGAGRGAAGAGQAERRGHRQAGHRS